MSTATAPCLTVADFLDDVARIMVYEHGHDIVTVYDNYLTFEGYILDVEFCGDAGVRACHAVLDQRQPLPPPPSGIIGRPNNP